MPTNLQSLINNYINSKNQVEDAKKNLLAAEAEIMSQVQDDLKKGTNTFGNLKIICSNNTSWNQLELMACRAAWPTSTEWPFASEYIADNKQIKYIDEHNKDLSKLLDKARSVSPKKPQFKLTGEKE